MRPETVGPFVVSLVALAISLLSLGFTATRFFVDIRDRRRSLTESRPYFVLRPMRRPAQGSRDTETWAAISNDGGATALDVFVTFAIGPDPEATIFTASATRLAPGETLETTNGALNYATRGFPQRWDDLRIEVGYRLPHTPTKFVVTPEIGRPVQRVHDRVRKIGPESA